MNTTITSWHDTAGLAVAGASLSIDPVPDPDMPGLLRATLHGAPDKLVPRPVHADFLMTPGEALAIAYRLRQAAERMLDDPRPPG